MPNAFDSSETDEAQEGSTNVAWERATCVLCGSSSNRIVLEASDLLYGCAGRFTLVRCQQCGHYYLDPRPTPQSIADFYPSQYGPHQDHQQPATKTVDEDVAGSPPKTPWYLSSLVRSIPGLRRLYYWMSKTDAEIIPEVATTPPRALELGCGNGRFMELLNEQGWETEGIEPAETPARRCIDRGLNVRLGEFEAMALDDGVYDVVFAWMVIEHLHDPALAICKIREVLKPEGLLLFSVPNFGSWEARIFGRYWYSLQLPTHLNHFSPKTLRRLLQQNGFEIVRLYHQQNVLNLIGSLGIWLRFKFPKRAIGQRLIHFTDNPTMWGRLLLSPLAKILSLLRQGGRLTVLARVDSKWPDTFQQTDKRTSNTS